MAWVVAFKVRCPLADTDAYLLEDRQYRQGEGTYSVVARRCSHDVNCNLDDHIRCEWNFKPGGAGQDPFGIEKEP